jgi:signal transduction histidine kinase
MGGDVIRAAPARAVRDLSYLAVGLVTSVVAMAVWIAGLSVSASLAVFIVGIYAIVGTAGAFRLVADLDRRNAARLLGAPLRGTYRDHGGAGLRARLMATLGDPQTRRDAVWMVLHSIVGLALGSIAVSGVAQVLGMATLPLWFWALPEGNELWGGWWTIDTVWKALVVALLAIPLAFVMMGLLRVMAVAELRLATGLLGPAPGVAVEAAAGGPSSRPWPERRRDLSAGFALHAALAALAGFVCTLLWGLTGRGYFWPAWVWLGLLLTVAVHASVVRTAQAAGDPVRSLRAKAELSGVVVAVCVAVWALAGGGYFWPIWPALGLGAALGVRALVAFRDTLPWARERQLVERVDTLTRTRRGALDVQAAELRRIERDLHDGAQSRLVALSMQLGRAEERLADQPDVAELVRQARGEASAAIAELRDLARGISPPVLADRGLAAAAQALGARAPMPVKVEADVPHRPLPVLENAAYFVVAEALTNVAKHAPAAQARVSIVLDDEHLVVQVTDDGPGGADPHGGGLTGLRHRVEALDGALQVTSPAGGGTTIRAELPCGS